MSSTKTLQEFMEDLRIELNDLDQRFDDLNDKLDGISKRRDSIKNALVLAQETFYSPSEEGGVNSRRQEQDFVATSATEAAYTFLIEQQKPCTTKEIAAAISSRGVKCKSYALLSTTRRALNTLIRNNKIVKIKRGLWALKIPILKSLAK